MTIQAAVTEETPSCSDAQFNAACRVFEERMRRSPQVDLLAWSAISNSGFDATQIPTYHCEPYVWDAEGGKAIGAILNFDYQGEPRHSELVLAQGVDSYRNKENPRELPSDEELGVVSSTWNYAYAGFCAQLGLVADSSDVRPNSNDESLVSVA